MKTLGSISVTVTKKCEITLEILSIKSTSHFGKASLTRARLFKTNDVVSYRLVKISNVNI